MPLLHLETLSLDEFNDLARFHYTQYSHTWEAGEETTLGEM
jgi:hypothetical protein